MVPMAVESETEWEVGPTHDVVEAFIVTLVQPRLPYTCLIDVPPSEDDHKAIAKQMHAVVLLYNYYHRKQKPELEFLDFVAFCKLALSLRSTLKPFMGTIHGSEEEELNGGEDNLSVTEKAIKSACDIALSLDASKDVPSIEGYPISTVAVLLIDSEKEHCLLQLNDVTEGVWSLIEKEVDQEVLAEERVSKKRKMNEQQPLSDHSKFLEIGLDAVKDVLKDIEVSDLEVLEAHVVYSLNKEKSATQFYMMKCKESFDIKKRFAFDSLVESLQGPFAEKFLDTWATTDLITYHRLLPYAELISSWVPRKDSSGPILSDCIAEIIKNKEARKTALSKIPASPLPEFGSVDFYINNSNTERISRKNSITERKTRYSQKVANGDTKVSQMKRRRSGKVASPVEFFCSTEKHGQAPDVSKTKVGHENVDKDSEKHGQGSLSGLTRDDDASQRIKNTSDLLKVPFSSGEKEKMESNTRSVYQSKNISSAQHHANGSKDGVRSRVVLPYKSKTNSSLRNYDQSRSIFSTQRDANGLEFGVRSEAETTDFFTSSYYQHRDERLTAENGDTTASGNQKERAATEENVTVHFEALYNTQVENVMHSEDLQNALALLDRKRQELCSRLYTTEDTLALYEHVIDRIRDGGEVGLARRCITSLVSGNDHLVLQNEVRAPGNAHQPCEDHSTPQPQKQTRFSNIYLPGSSSCQDLEYACLKNNWRLPRYFVQPTDGKFLSNVIVHCTGSALTLSSKGGAESSPVEARESAAAQMIEKIRERS